jgi:hypothetical protein
MVHTNNNGGEDAFGSTFNKGYFMNINGYRISVQFGYGNYVDGDIRYGRQSKVTKLANDEGCVLYDISQKFNVWQSNLAEVMINMPEGMPDFGMDDGILNDQVMGHCTAECVAKLIGCIASADANVDIRQALTQIYQSN